MQRSITPLRWDLGIRTLFSEWKALFGRENWRADTLAAFQVAALSLPLSLAIALATGLPASVGIYTAVVAGALGALTNSSPLAISGPSAAMAVLIAAAYDRFGVEGVALIAAACGGAQILIGVFRMGSIVRFLPNSVIAGFIAGTGATLMVAQAPRALGLPAPDSSHILDVLTHAWEYLEHAQPLSLGIFGFSGVLAWFLTRGQSRWPGMFLAVALPAIAVFAFDWQVAQVGPMPHSLPNVRLPHLESGDLASLLGTAFLVFIVASIQTLVSSSTVEKYAQTRRFDADQELISQGIANLGASVFGGMPVTNAIARSIVNARAGAKTRRAAILQALFLGAVAWSCADAIAYIPIPALAAVLFVVALRMVNLREFRSLAVASRTDASIYLLTFLVILSVDLFAGVQIGAIAALAIVVLRIGRTTILAHEGKTGAYRFTFSGPLTFLATGNFDDLRRRFGELKKERGAIFDLRSVTSLDNTAAETLRRLANDLRSDGWRTAILSANADTMATLRQVDGNSSLKPSLATTEAEVSGILHNLNDGSSQRERLVVGVETFRAIEAQRLEPLFDQLSDSQKPHSLFITCSDSRIQPSLITSAVPGELFIVRNVGNLFPPSETDSAPAESAALEYALEALGVRQIVICGHSSCGAMKALISGKIPETMPNVEKWLCGALTPRSMEELQRCKTPEEAAQRNVVLQLENLRKSPMVQKYSRDGSLTLSGWYYDIGAGEVLEWNPDAKLFAPVGGAPPAPKETHA